MQFPRLILLVLLALPALAHGADASRIPHGVIHFYEPQAWRQPQTDWRDPAVTGAEAIFWWGDIELEEGRYDWSRVDSELAKCQKNGKQLDLRLGTAHNSPLIAPQWLFDNYPVRRIGRGYWTDFEDGLGDYNLGPDGGRTEAANLVVAGKFSVANLTTNAGAKIICRLNRLIRLEPGAEFSLGLDYRASQSLTGWVEITSETERLTNRMTFAASALQLASQNFRVKIPAADDCQIRFGFDGPGTLALDNLNLIRLAAWPAAHITDFENTDDDWQLSGGAQFTHSVSQVISGHSSLLLGGDTAAIANREPQLTLERGQGYAFEFNFKAPAAGTLRYRIVSRDAPDEPLAEQIIKFQPGESGHRKFYFPAFLWRDHCRVEFAVEGPGQLVLDDLSWTRWSDRVTCFPDYFNPVFQQKWERFVTAFAARYGENPSVGTISVGGFGRWEETILDDDAYGGLDAQWLARGYTPEKYLARITDCLDLYRRLLPHKPLRICLAYGLYHRNHRDWIYRRVAQAAVARGVGLKQNGLSEKWDMWDDNTSASYLWNRYRFTPGVTLTLETGGQIARPGPGQGHPLSFLNRGLIDGTDILSLYGSDIAACRVHEYFRYANEQLGRPLFTSFYCRLGDTSLKHENSFERMEYRNLWLGLRQFQDREAEVSYTNFLGEMCAATSSGNPRIIFDVDDRQQYNGMFGVVVSVKYLDAGRDTFKVNGFNQWTGQWQQLGAINKTNTGVWKMASFTASEWCRSPRDTGEDVHADIVIDDGGDGIEHIADVELQFVPAREWQRRLLAAAEPAMQREVLTNVLNREIVIPDGQPLCGIAVPLWSGSVAANAVRGRVYAVTIAGEKLVGDKQYTLPADRDWFELPVAPEPGCSRYRMELSQPTGVVGWYRALDGALAYHAWSYAEPTNKVAAARAIDEINPLAERFTFNAPEPFFGLRLNFAATNTEIRCRLRRELPGTGWSPVITEQIVMPHIGEPGTVYFEPQTAGRYQVEMLTNAPEVTAVTPILLTRRTAPLPPLPFAKPGGIALFDPSASHNPKLKLDSGLAGAGRSADTLNLAVLSSAAGFEVTPNSPLTAKLGQVLAMRMRNHTGAAFARIYWADDRAGFSSDRSVLVPLVQNDTELREYHCTLDLEPGWYGKIRRWRIEPADGLAVNGIIGLGVVRVLDSAAYTPPPVKKYP